MDVNPIFFFAFASLAIAFALMVILLKNPVSSAFSLVMVFFCFAAIYAMLGAHLVATLQVLVYAGAIMVLFVFVIMLLNASEPSFDFRRSHPVLRVCAGIASVALLALLIVSLKNSSMPQGIGQYTAEKVAEAGGNTRVVSRLMFSEFVLPFELTSVLLLGAIVGAVSLAKRKLSNGKDGE